MPEIEVWTIPQCPQCDQTKAELRDSGFSFREQSMEALRTGDIMDVDALTESVMRDGIAPMIRVEGRFVSQVEFEAMLTGAE